MSGKSKEPTRHQLSSRLQYNSQVPAFLQKLQNRVAGVPDDDPEEDEYGYGYGRDEYEYVNDGSGRPPIPKRPPIPERPADDPGSAAEEDDEERDGEGPQIVVLKEGKHLSEREVENERRKGMCACELVYVRGHADGVCIWFARSEGVATSTG